MIRAVEKWISDEELNSVYSSTYWNDVEQERSKFWWIEGGDYEKCRTYLESGHLMHEFQRSIEYIDALRGESLRVADLAAGIGWTSVLLSRLSKVAEVHSVEISKHRIGPLFEQCVEMFAGEVDKIYRYLGSFYDLHFDDRSMDVIFMSQAFHHADKPFKLLAECDRVLKPGGRIIIVGEHYMSRYKIFKRILTSLAMNKKWTTNFYELFPPDEELGDHYYRVSDYYFLFGSMGFKLQHYSVASDRLIYVADKSME
ncbi:MAG: class I SAM-dependent methyltransferase [Candidatus Omnitrophica bacterium]|nr:class I SAM-dependent methyltransferase [Candidatus Omnitrophota bacterium]